MLLLGIIEILITAVIAGLAGFVAGAGVMAATAARRGGGAPALSGGAGPAALPGGRTDVLSASVKDLRRGAFVSVGGFGDEFEDVQLEVERYTKYSRGRDAWHELQATYRDRPVALMWHEDREGLHLYAVKRLRAQGLDALGLTPEALAALEPGAEHTHEGTTWRVEAAGQALAHEGGIGFGKEHASWELASQDGKRLARIERWGDEPHAVSVGEALDPSQVEIYRVKT